MSRFLMFGLSLVLLGFAPAPFARPERKRGENLADLTGQWVFVECLSGGRVYADTRDTKKLEVTPERFTFQNKDGSTCTVWDVKLDPSASPPAFTWGRNGRVSWVGSYRLQNGQLTLIFSNGTDLARRPIDFDYSHPQWTYVLKRVRR